MANNCQAGMLAEMFSLQLSYVTGEKHGSFITSRRHRLNRRADRSPLGSRVPISAWVIG